MSERPKTIPELRGHTAIPRDRAKPYSAASYASLYGITVEDAEYLLDRHDSHSQIERAINQMFIEDPGLKDRAINWDKYEREETERIRAEVEAKRKAERDKKLQEIKEEERRRETAKKEIKPDKERH